MLKFLIKIKKLISKDLNEFVKWVILLGLYLFYRMMEKAFDEKQLVFLVIPLVFLGVVVFVIDWIIDDLILSLDKIHNQKKEDWVFSRIVSFIFLLGPALFILFYIFEQVELINAALLALLIAPLLSKRNILNKKFGRQHWTNWVSILLIFLGLGGLFHAIYFSNGLNTISFVFYIGCLLFYFLVINMYPKKAL